MCDRASACCCLVYSDSRQWLDRSAGVVVCANWGMVKLRQQRSAEPSVACPFGIRLFAPVVVQSSRQHVHAVCQLFVGEIMCCVCRCVPTDGVEVSLDSQLLEEGGALAVGAAFGATAVIIEQEPRRRSTSTSMPSSLKRVLQAAAAVVGSPNLSRPLELLARRSSDTGRRRSNVGEPEVVLPPVPMHPADKVLSMQVSCGPAAVCSNCC